MSFAAAAPALHTGPTTAQPNRRRYWRPLPEPRQAPAANPIVTTVNLRMVADGISAARSVRPPSPGESALHRQESDETGGDQSANRLAFAEPGGNWHE